MNKNSKRVLAVVAASALAFGTVVTSQANAAVKEVTLMFQGPLTGPDAQLGQDQLPGAVYAIAIYSKMNRCKSFFVSFFEKIIYCCHI